MRVYADNAATTAMSPAAIKALTDCMEQYYGNPSSLHEEGQEAAQVLERAREDIAACLGAKPEEIYFTSGGTEADNWAITNMASFGARKNKRHIISSAFEHHAVLHTLNKLEKQGFEVTLLEVHEDGLVRPEELEAAIREDTALVTIMYANNEVGTVQPITELAAICKAHGVPFHTDAVQAAGHLPINVAEQQIDLLSLSGHKFNGPKGVGVLYCRKGIPLLPFQEGGAQERGKRGGTENLPSIVGMAAALKETVTNQEEEAVRLTALRDKLIAGLSQVPRSRLNGHPTKRLPGNVSFCFEGVEGESLLLRADLVGIAGSSGSACTSGSLDPSHVLLSLGLPHEIAHGSLRLSLGRFNTEEEIDYMLEKLPPIIAQLRDMSPVWERIMKGEQVK